MRCIPILILLLAPGVLAAQSNADPKPSSAAPAGEAPILRDRVVQKGVKIDVPGHSGVKLTRLWDAFNNCVLEDGTQADMTLSEFFQISVTTRSGGSCWDETSRMHWKLEFLPAGSVNGYAEIGIEQNGAGGAGYFSFCNPRGTDRYPKVACRTGHQVGSDTIVVGIDREPREVRTSLRIDGKGRATGVKITPLYNSSTGCVQKDATQTDKATGTSVDLKVTANDDDGQCWANQFNSISWRVEFVPEYAAKGYAEVILSGSPKAGYTASCFENGTRRMPPETGDIECQARSAPAGSGIGLTIHP